MDTNKKLTPKQILKKGVDNAQGVGHSKRMKHKTYYSFRETSSHFEFHVGTKADCLKFESLSKRWCKAWPENTKKKVMEIIEGDVKEFGLIPCDK